MIIQTKKSARSEARELDDAWATLIKAKDNWCCVICGSDYSPCAHHLCPREHKQYKYEPDNGITLCVKHHKFSRILSAHNNPFAFFLWLSKYCPDLYSAAAARNRQIAASEGISI